MRKKPITTGELRQLKAKLKGRRTELTDKEVETLPPAPTGTRYEVNDPGLAKFGVRVNDKGEGTYILIARFPDPKQ